MSIYDTYPASRELPTSLPPQSASLYLTGHYLSQNAWSVKLFFSLKYNNSIFSVLATQVKIPPTFLTAQKETQHQPDLLCIDALDLRYRI